MRINQLVTNQIFGSVLKTDELFNSSQMKVANDIKNKMNTTYIGHFNNQTPNNYLENKGRDTLIARGNSENSVRYFVTTQATNDPAVRPTVKVDYFVGEYSENKPFFVQDIKEANKRAWMNVGVMGLVAACGLSIMISMSNFRKNHSKDKIIQQTEIITDTLKNAVKNDTIAPFKMK